MPKYSIAKKILLILLLVSNTICLNAQESKKLTYVLKVGTCYPIVYENLDFQYLGGHDHYSASFQSTLGYYGNVSVNIPLQNRYSFSFGLSYHKNKFKLKRNWNIATMNMGMDRGTIESSYLILPLTIKHSFTKTCPLDFGLGPYIGFLINSEDKGISHDGKYYNNNAVNSTFFYKQVDFGIITQLNFSFIQQEKYEILIFTDFQCGLMNAKKHIESDDSKWMNLNWMFGLGVLLK